MAVVVAPAVCKLIYIRVMSPAQSLPARSSQHWLVSSSEPNLVQTVVIVVVIVVAELAD